MAPEKVPKFTADMLQQDCETASASGAGWDQWEVADWRNLSDKAAQALANLLNDIEEGLDWPEPLHWGKAYFLAKTDEASLDPMDYMIILVLQRLYRRWASVRLQHPST